MPISETHRTEKQFGHEPVIWDGRLVVGAIGEHLHFISCSIARAKTTSIPKLAEGRRTLLHKEQAKRLLRVIAGHLVRVLEIVANEHTVIVKRGEALDQNASSRLSLVRTISSPTSS